MMILIASTTGLVLAVALLIFMLISNIHAQIISDLSVIELDESEEEKLEKNRTLPREAWKPSHGVLSEDDYREGGIVLLQVDSMEKEDLAEALYEHAANACLSADNAILRAMRNQNANT